MNEVPRCAARLNAGFTPKSPVGHHAPRPWVSRNEGHPGAQGVQHLALQLMVPIHHGMRGLIMVATGSAGRWEVVWQGERQPTSGRKVRPSSCDLVQIQSVPLLGKDVDCSAGDKTPGSLGPEVYPGQTLECHFIVLRDTRMLVAYLQQRICNYC